MRIMPKIIHDPLNPSKGIELPTIPPEEWMDTVEKMVGQSLNKAEKAYAITLAEHYNWTATITADHLRLNRAAPELLEALQAILSSEDTTLGDGGSILGDDYRKWATDTIALAQGGDDTSALADEHEEDCYEDEGEAAFGNPE